MKVLIVLLFSAAALLLHTDGHSQKLHNKALKEEAKLEKQLEKILGKPFKIETKKLLKRLLKKWESPSKAFREKIELTLKQFEFWESLEHFIAPGEESEPLEARFCGCEAGNDSSATPTRKRRFLGSIAANIQKAIDSVLAAFRHIHPIIPPKPIEICDLPVTRIERMEWRRMSTATKSSFVNAMNSLATHIPDPLGAPSESAHDIFVKWHRSSESPGAHGGPSFLPWHREFLWRFENALRDRGYTGALPYWDSGLDAPLPDPTASAIWTPGQLGVSNGFVSAPFSSVDPMPSCNRGNNFIFRNAQAGATTYLFARSKVADILTKTCYSDLTTLEGYHNTVHVWFGSNSHMLDLNCAATDPAFWMHHCYIDAVWEFFRQEKQPDILDREKDYPINAGFFSAWNAPMRPFDSSINIDGLRNQYTNVYYSYQNRPSAIVCGSDADCDGPNGGGLLWCLVPNRVCYGKIKVEGACRPDWPSTQCYCITGTPACTSGVCTC